MLAAMPSEGAAISAAPVAAVIDPVAGRGEMLFRAKGCATCHSIADRGMRSLIGSGPPDLSRLADVGAARRPWLTAEMYLRESVLAPQAYVAPEHLSLQLEMPPLPMREDELAALAAFLLSTR